MSEVTCILLSDSEQCVFESIQFIFLNYPGKEIEYETGVAAVETISMINDIHLLYPKK